MTDGLSSGSPLDSVVGWLEQTMAFGVIITDARLVIRVWNEWLAHQSGISAEHAVGRSLFEVCKDMPERGLDHYYADVLSGQVRVVSQRLHGYVVASPQKFGDVVSPMPQSGRIAPLLDQGRVVGTITLVFDVTDRVETERELRRKYEESERARHDAEAASRAKDEFLATISHELRNPLNAITGWTHILRSARPDDHGLQVVDRNAMLMTRMIEDMLDVARILTGKLALERRRTDCADVVRTAIDMVRPAAVARQIAIVMAPAPPLTPLNADPMRLQQVVLNLLQNAIKFTDVQGRIDVRLTADGDNSVLTVTDNGRGISPDFLPHVFERFQQGDATTTRRHGGLGLGLALVRQLVELHGGSVRAQSDGEGRGAMFEVVLPGDRSLKTEQEKPARTAPCAAVSLRGLRVLVVDDNPDIVGLVTAVLEARDADVIRASGVAEAMAALHRDPPPQFVIADLGMPDVDGYTFIRQVRALSGPLAAVPAVAISAIAGVEKRTAILKAGYDAYLPKPFTPEELTDIVSDVASRRLPGR